MFFGPKLTSVFRNRWMALLWAAGIIWGAVDFVGDSHATHPGKPAGDQQTVTDADDQPLSAQDVAVIKKLVDGK